MKRALPALVTFVVASAAGAQETPQPTWRVDTPRDAPATLAYGLESAAPILVLRCERGLGQVRVSVELERRLADRKIGEVWADKVGIREPWPMSLALASRDSAMTLRGEGRANEAARGTTASAEFSTRAPFASALRKSGEIGLTVIGETVQPQPAPKGQVRKFLRACK